jgi:hypothetical protein
MSRFIGLFVPSYLFGGRLTVSGSADAAAQPIAKAGCVLASQPVYERRPWREARGEGR